MKLHVVRCTDGKVAVGPRQVEWLLEHGHLGELEENDAIREWPELRGITVRQLDALMLDQRELRECDFCRLPQGGWLIHHKRPVRWTLHPGTGPRLIERPFVCCDECVAFVRSNDKALMVRHCIERLYRQVQHEVERDLKASNAQYRVMWPSFAHAERALTPMVREVVYGMFSVREGEPVEDV